MYKGYEHTIVITNRMLVQGDFFQQMEKVIRLHPHVVILREKDLPDDAYEVMAEKLLKLCAAENVNAFCTQGPWRQKDLDAAGFMFRSHSLRQWEKTSGSS